MLGLAVVLQLVSITFAPLIVVQPLGAVALVITAFLTARTTHQPLGRKAKRAIALCVGGVGFFVLVAAIFASERPISERELGIILGILLGVFALLGVAFALLRSRFRAGYSIVTAGVLFGFVATLAKVVINRIITGNFEFLTVLCIIGLLAAAGIGSYFVQNAYASGPPDLVIAGLTVIDPLVAVGIGILVLGEASGAPWFAVVAFLAAAVVAITGVRQLSKYHPHEA
jgi:drug/metabolite transporter (DMT)-like permease